MKTVIANGCQLNITVILDIFRQSTYLIHQLESPIHPQGHQTLVHRTLQQVQEGQVEQDITLTPTAIGFSHRHITTLDHQEPQHSVETDHTVSVKAEEELVPITVVLQDGIKRFIINVYILCGFYYLFSHYFLHHIKNNQVLYEYR